MKIYLGSDHAGYELKNALIEHLTKTDNEIIDKGAFNYDEDDDYPKYMHAVAKEISENEHAIGIVLGGSGQGEAIVCNRYEGVRAVVYYGGSEEIIKLSREHNNANILSLGARFLTEGEAIQAVDLWLETKFSEEERHVRRLNLLENVYLNDFDSWNFVKKKISKQSVSNIYFKERDIWWCSLGANIGHEQSGTGNYFDRPVLVLKKFNPFICLVIPLTKGRKNNKYYFNLGKIDKTISYAILSQLRLIDVHRLRNKITTIDKEKFKEIENALMSVNKAT